MLNQPSSTDGSKLQKTWASCTLPVGLSCEVVIRFVPYLYCLLSDTHQSLQAGEYFIENVLRGKGTVNRTKSLVGEEKVDLSAPTSTNL